MIEIEKIYQDKCQNKNDINEHLPTLKKYTEKCDVVIEMGVRSIVSTWAFLAGKPKKLISIDIVEPKNFLNHDPSGCNLDLVSFLAKKNDIDFEFVLGNTLEISIQECDFLFIDTLHNYEQLTKELELHACKVKKYIGFHDTESFKNIGELNNDQGIWKAIEEFFLSNKEWVICEKFLNNNGLTIIQKINNESKND